MTIWRVYTIFSHTKPCPFHKKCIAIQNWLVVSTPLNNISQREGLSQIVWTIKNVWNHQPENAQSLLLFLLSFPGWPNWENLEPSEPVTPSSSRPRQGSSSSVQTPEMWWLWRCDELKQGYHFFGGHNSKRGQSTTEGKPWGYDNKSLELLILSPNKLWLCLYYPILLDATPHEHKFDHLVIY